MKTLLILLFLMLAACAENNTSSPSKAPPKETGNETRLPSAALCAEISARPANKTFFIYLDPELLMIADDSTFMIDQLGGVTPYMSGNLQVGTYCVLEIQGGKLVGVQ
ncbi:MAG TPA: hypothetical protein PKJ68_06635 [Candidatus Woesebacteria bacterium]|nr:hypothetical protein [Candidatus Woesebacteria bacterium]